jgi:hypothetical protein
MTCYLAEVDWKGTVPFLVRFGALDPGASGGLAAFSPTFRLLALAQGWPRDLEDLAFEWGIPQLVAETPEIYRKKPGATGKARGNPNALIGLACQSHYLAGSLGLPQDRLKTYRPREWKASVSKPAHHNRIMRALLPEEAASVEALIAQVPTKKTRKKGPDGLPIPPPEGHDKIRDALDALAIGLFHAGVQVINGE